MNRLICGADWQSAVSRVGNPQTATIHSPTRRLPIGETADYQSALPDSHGSLAQCGHKVRGVLSWGRGTGWSNSLTASLRPRERECAITSP